MAEASVLIVLVLLAFVIVALMAKGNAEYERRLREMALRRQINALADAIATLAPAFERLAEAANKTSSSISAFIEAVHERKRP